MSVLKLLYLIRYIDDIKANIDNIAILMVDDIRTDKIMLRREIAESLERLEAQNYVARNGDNYSFLTDEEQDIAIDIRNTSVDSATIVQSIGQTIFSEIYPSKKYKYNKYDFAYDQYIDETIVGAATGGVRLRFVTVASDYYNAPEQKLIMDSQVNNEAIAFVGNINQSVDVLLKTSHLFDPFPEAMAYDTAFLDRMHCYIPGWEIPKYRPESFTNGYGFITDYLAEFMREMRKEPFGDVSDKYFRFGNNLNQRDVIAVRKIVSGFTKLLYPNGEFSKEDIEEILTFALEMRRRVKEQLKKIGGMEFYDVNFSYIDNETFEEHYVSVPEQGGGKIIPEGLTNPGNVYTVSQGKSGMIGVYRLETQMLPGNGKFERTGLGSDRDVKEATNTAFNYLKASGNQISGQISTTTKDYIINYQDLNGIGMTKFLTLPTVIALASCALNKPTLSSLAVLGEISISGTILKVEELASVLQVCLDAGAKKVLIPITSAADLGTVPSDLIGAFSLIFYSTPQEAVFKALGVE